MTLNELKEGVTFEHEGIEYFAVYDEFSPIPEAHEGDFPVKIIGKFPEGRYLINAWFNPLLLDIPERFQSAAAWMCFKSYARALKEKTPDAILPEKPSEQKR